MLDKAHIRLVSQFYSVFKHNMGNKTLPNGQIVHTIHSRAFRIRIWESCLMYAHLWVFCLSYKYNPDMAKTLFQVELVISPKQRICVTRHWHTNTHYIPLAIRYVYMDNDLMWFYYCFALIAVRCLFSESMSMTLLATISHNHRMVDHFILVFPCQIVSCFSVPERSLRYGLSRACPARWIRRKIRLTDQNYDDWSRLSSIIIVRRQGLHMPFNFTLVLKMNENSRAPNAKNEVEEWLAVTPAGKWIHLNKIWLFANRCRRFSENKMDCFLELVIISFLHNAEILCQNLSALAVNSIAMLIYCPTDHCADNHRRI